MFSMCSELTPRARIPDTRIPQLMQPWCEDCFSTKSLLPSIPLLLLLVLLQETVLGEDGAHGVDGEDGALRPVLLHLSGKRLHIDT